MMKYNPPVTTIEIGQKPHTAQDFINERVVNRNMTQALCREIEEFNKTLQREAEMWGEREYEYVYITRHNPDNYTDHFYPAIGKVYNRL